jgi:hypothetical protein
LTYNISGLFPPKNQGGFAGSEHGSVRATIYRRGDTIFNIESSPIYLDGQTQQSDNPSILSAQIQNAFGSGGSFQISLKCQNGVNLLELIEDDDWVDIELGRNGVYYHVMRGLVDEVRQSISVSGSGATSSNYLIAGQSFQKIWAQTPLWFSSKLAENLGTGDKTTQLFQYLQGTLRNVPGTIASFLFDYTNKVAQDGRSSVAMPPGMPGVKRNFAGSWRQDETHFSDQDAPRVNILRNNFFPSQNIWEVASQWSDPYFCEMFTDILPAVPSRPSGRPVDIGGTPQFINAASAISALGLSSPIAPLGLPINRTAMTLVIRNKPFINMSFNNSSRVGMASDWFSLPMYSIPKQHIVATDLGKNGYERANAFFCASLIQNGGNDAPTNDLAVPSWSVPDMRVHGLRTMDTVTRYQAASTGLPGFDANALQRRLRSRLRDWYMANSTYQSGTVTLGRGYPEIHIGTRLRLIGNTEAEQKTFYIESVAHSYSAVQGLRTTVGVTRGYEGTDKSHLKNLSAILSTYTIPFG